MANFARSKASMIGEGRDRAATCYTAAPMTAAFWDFDLRLPRHAFSARGAARAGDIWRCFQEAALEGSSRAGWPPARYRAGGNAFVVGDMTVRHDREARYGDPVRAKTWVSRFQRGTIAVREVRLSTQGTPIARATQKWVHVDADLRPRRAPDELIAAFAEHHEDPSVVMPTFEDAGAPSPKLRFTFRPWYTAMDPLDHVNHPAYVDWCDEVICRRLDEHDIWPAELVPVAERITFKAAAGARDDVAIETQGTYFATDSIGVFRHRISDATGRLLATATTVRKLANRPERLVEAFR